MKCDYVDYYYYYWSFLYSAILRSRADSLRSHVILHEGTAFYSAFLNIHQQLLPSRRVLCTPYNHALCHFMQSHICKVYACLAVTCHLRFGRMTGVFYVLLQWYSPVVCFLITRDYVNSQLFSCELKLYGIARNTNGSLKKRTSKQILPRPCIVSFKGNTQQQQGEHSTFHVLGSAAESSCYNYVS